MFINKSLSYGFRAVSTFAVLSVFSGSASAQEAGTNVATPAPTQTPNALSGQAVTLEVSPTTTAISNNNEPVIDASSTRKTRPNRPLLITGVTLLAASYGTSAIVAGFSDREADDKLFYPVVGPWLDLNHRGCNVNPCSNNTLDRVLLVGDGVLQGLGALGMVLSIIVPEKTTRHWYLIGNNDVIVAPSIGNGVMGLGAAGRF